MTSIYSTLPYIHTKRKSISLHMHEYCYFKFGYLKWMINLNLQVSLSRDHRAKSEICMEQLLTLCVFVIFSTCKLLHLSLNRAKAVNGIFGETLKIQSCFKTSKTDKLLKSQYFQKSSKLGKDLGWGVLFLKQPAFTYVSIYQLQDLKAQLGFLHELLYLQQKRLLS